MLQCLLLLLLTTPTIKKWFHLLLQLHIFHLQQLVIVSLLLNYCNTHYDILTKQTCLPQNDTMSATVCSAIEYQFYNNNKIQNYASMNEWITEYPHVILLVPIITSSTTTNTNAARGLTEEKWSYNSNYNYNFYPDSCINASAHFSLFVLS